MKNILYSLGLSASVFVVGACLFSLGIAAAAPITGTYGAAIILSRGFAAKSRGYKFSEMTFYGGIVVGIGLLLGAVSLLAEPEQPKHTAINPSQATSSNFVLNNVREKIPTNLSISQVFKQSNFNEISIIAHAETVQTIALGTRKTDISPTYNL